LSLRRFYRRCVWLRLRMIYQDPEEGFPANYTRFGILMIFF